MTFCNYLFCGFVGEELTVFGFVNGECEKTLRTTGIDSYSRVDKGVLVGSCRVNRLLFTDVLVLLASSE